MADKEKRIRYEGKVHVFPSTFSDDDIAQALAIAHEGAAKPAAVAPPPPGPTPPGPAKPPLPAELRRGPAPNAWQQYWQGGVPDTGIGGTILNMPRKGVEQVERGAGRVAAGIKSGGLMAPDSQGRRDLAGGLSDVFEGAGQVAAPVALPAAAVMAPIPTAIALGAGGLAGWGAKIAATKSGLAPEYAALLGDVANVVAGGLGPKAVNGLFNRIAIMKPNAAIAELVKFADDYNIPLSASARTGIEWIRRFQGRTRETPRAAKSQAATQQGLARTAEKLREGPETTRIRAGGGVAKDLRTAKEGYAAGAKDAYTALEEIEADPANQEDVVVGTKRVDTGFFDETGRNKIFREEPIIEKIGLPVRIARAKAALKPIAAQIEKDMPLTERQASGGLSKLNQLLEEKDVIAATKLDKYLADVKTLLRSPGVTASSKRVLGLALDELEPELGHALTKGGPDAVQALAEGRRLTEAKYAVRRTMKALGVKDEDDLPTEPVKLFKKLTVKEDANVGLLNTVKRYAPDSLPAVGRALLEGLFDAALGKNGVMSPAAALKAWGRVGDQTKGVLFSPKQVAALDRFFRLAELESRTPKAVPATIAGATGGQLPLDKTDVVMALPGFIELAAQFALHQGVGGSAIKASLGMLAAKRIGSSVTRNLSRALWNPETARALTDGILVRSRPLMSTAVAAGESGLRGMPTPPPKKPPGAPQQPPGASPGGKPRASATSFTPEMKQAFMQNGDLAPVLMKMANVESGGDPQAVSPKGARGIMQFMPDAAKQWSVDVTDPVSSIKGAGRYMRWLLNRYHGDMKLALAAFNAGPANVDKYGRVPPFRETQDYVDRVTAAR